MYILIVMCSGEVKTEIIRKSIHCLIALVPLMASINRAFTLVFLVIGILGYAIMETLRVKGVKVPVISSLTSLAARSPDTARFEMGPVTLGLGALLALLLFSQGNCSPEDLSPAASIAIFALAFGDGAAGLAGKAFGRLRPPCMFGKSVEGSLACFFTVLIISWLALKSIFPALVAACIAALIEALPLNEFDNLVLPLAVGFALQLLLGS